MWRLCDVSSILSSKCYWKCLLDDLPAGLSLLRNFTFSSRIYYLILITSHANTTYSYLYRRKCLQLSKYPVLNDSLGFVVTFFVEQRRESSRRKTANEQRNIRKNHWNVFRHRKIRSRRSVFLCCETNFIIFSKLSRHHLITQPVIWIDTHLQKTFPTCR